MTALDTPDQDDLTMDLTAGPRSDKVEIVALPHHADPARSSKRQIVIPGALIALAVLAGWFVFYAVVLTGLQEHGSQARLYEKLRSELANETAPLGDPISPGRAVAILSGPASLDRVVVVEGSTSHQLESGPGHLPSTPLPGQIGDSEILGRSLTYGAPFAAITRLKPGDVITATTGEGAFTYRVEDVRYPGDRLPAPLTTGQSRLTLITAGRGGWLDALAPTHAIYVDALLVHGKAQPVPASLPSTGKSSLPMHNQPDALVPLIFWLEALVLVSVAVAWGWVRWGRPQTWLVGAPLMLAVIWGTSNALVPFLPNLI